MSAAPAPPSVGPLDPAHDTEVAAALARAFLDDPVWEWILRDESSRLRRMATLFHLLLGSTRRLGGEVWATDDLAGAALWHAPDRWRTPPLEMLRQAPRLTRVFGLEGRRGLKLLEFIEQHHPREPHWHLAVLGTDPIAQGRGVGGALLAPMLERCDREGVPAYLESSKERNVPYYARFGFEVTEALTFPDGPTLWGMWRTPR